MLHHADHSLTDQSSGGRHEPFSTDGAAAAEELLLYFYGREYWSTARASMALAKMSDDKEAQLMRRNAELEAHTQQLMTSHIALQVQLRELKAVHVNLVKQTEGVCFWAAQLTISVCALVESCSC